MKNLSLRDILTKVHCAQSSQTQVIQKTSLNKKLCTIQEVSDEETNSQHNEILQVVNEHMNQVPLIASHLQENGNVILPVQKYNNNNNNNNTMINSNNTNINPITVVFNNRSKYSNLFQKDKFFKLSLLTRICLIIFILLLLTLIVLVSINTVDIFRLKKVNSRNMNKEELVAHFNELHSKIDQLNQLFNDNQNFTHGTTCSCPQICKELGYRNSACANGSQCICKNTYISIEEIQKNCSCDRWCKRQGHKNGGFCGDENTCICSRKI